MAKESRRGESLDRVLSCNHPSTEQQTSNNPSEVNKRRSASESNLLAASEAKPEAKMENEDGFYRR